MQKLYDAVVKTGSYTNSQGEEKARYENVGSVMQGDNGQFLILKRTFNPAGVPNPDNKDSIIVSMFEPKDQQNNQQQQNRAPQQQQGGYQQQQAPQQQQQQQQQQNNGYNQQRG
jgi:hypothetical protein